MRRLLSSIADKKMNRRDFLKGSAVATASIAALGLVGCKANEVVDDTTKETEQGTVANSETGVTHPEPTNREAEGTWVAAPCWHNCAGCCTNKVMVIDGVVVRQKTDDSHEDTWEYPQQRSCLKGRSQQQQCFGADRLKYPMKRKHWEPLTGGKKELRGVDEWERITWEEAYKYIADEFKHCIDNYGNEAILVPTLFSAGADSLLNYLGGHSSAWDSTSYGSFVQNIGALGMPYMNENANDRFDLFNAEYVVFDGANPAWSSLGNAMYNLTEAKKRGTEMILIGPSYNATMQALDAKWIPIRPGTDTALMLGIAHQMIKEDVVDYEFLNKYTVGFDAEHMPEDATVNENFKDYILGEYDGVVKDATWASAICGTSVDDIIYLAKVLGKDNKTMFLHGFAPARINGGENFPQAFMTVGLMGGHVGKSGHAVSVGADTTNLLNKGPSLVKGGKNGLKLPGNPITKVIPGPQVWDAVVTGKYIDVGNAWGAGIYNGVETTLDVHVIACNVTGNYLQTGPNMNRGIEAFRKVDFVVSRGSYMTTNCKYADIVLPLATRWEYAGDVKAGNRETLQVTSQVTAPLYESKSDQEIDCGVLEAMGYDPKTLYPYSEKAQYFNKIKGCTVITEAGDAYEPLVTITQADIDDWGVKDELVAAGQTCEPQEGKIALKDFVAQGNYQVARNKDDNYGYIGYQAFIADPVANPLTSKSGKFEIYCQGKADQINNVAFSNLEVKPYANYFVPISGYEHTFVDADPTKEKGEYPFIAYNPHYIARVHSTLDNNRWLQEAFADPMYISKEDAKARGVVTGDTVVVYNQYGKILRRVSVIPGMVPGVVAIPHGSNVNMDEANGVDRGGADNILVGYPAYGLGVTGYNNINVNFEKYDGEPLAERYERPLMIFED